MKKTIIKVSAAVFIAAIIIAAVKIFGALKNLNDTGWSLSNKTEEITINISEYEMGIEYWETMDYIKAEEYLSKAAEISDTQNGTGSIVSAGIRQKLGSLYLEMGKYDDAYDNLNSAYVTFRDKLGTEDGNTIAAKLHMAEYEIKVGDIEQGFASLNELYDETSYVAYRIEIVQRIAECNIELGNYQKAFEWYENALIPLYTNFDRPDLDRINLINDYGVLLAEVGEYQESISTLLGAASEWQALELSEDAVIANIYSNLASAYAFCNENDSALEYAENALEIYKNVYGENNIYVALLYQKISGVYGRTEGYQEQLECLQKALEIAEDSVGENHMGTAQIYLSLGYCYQDIGDIEKAFDMHEKALEIRKNILGLNNISTSAVYQALVYDCLIAGDYDEGCSYALRAIEICEGLYGRENIYTADCYGTAAKVYSADGNNEEAIRLAELAFDIYSRQKDNAGEQWANIHQILGYVYLNSGNYEEAQSYLEKNIVLLKNEHREYTFDLMNTYLELGDLLLENDESGASEAYYNAYEISIVLMNEDVISEYFEDRLNRLYEKSAVTE